MQFSFFNFEKYYLLAGSSNYSSYQNAQSSYEKALFNAANQYYSNRGNRGKGRGGSGRGRGGGSGRGSFSQTQKLFCLHVFRQAGPPQQVHCLAPRREIAISVFRMYTAMCYCIRSRTKDLQPFDH